ncbi:Ribosome maturation factor RimM [Natranaerofaba carboxydovora]|nr:Ribosome maturation factor RimM [Natranaerofaba carboxydovora]
MVSVGKIIGFHGVKGEVKVLPLTDNPDRFSELDRVFLNGDDVSYVAHIQNAFWHKNNIVVKFKEYNSRDEVTSLKDYLINILKEERPKLGEGEYYYDEIIGLKVYDIDENYLGEIAEIKETGSNDVYIVRDEDREFLLPALKQIVNNIDLDNGRMEVSLMEGLID